jgi:large subunit ribosomal protein L3
MINGILGTKLGMSQMYVESGELVPVTLVQAGPCYVIQKKVKETDGYEAVQVAFGPKKEARVNKPLSGHMAKAGKGTFCHLKEFECADLAAVNIGDEITAGDVFAAGEKIKAIGVSKGRGYAGVVKRHGFGGLRASHGSLIHRSSGSIGTHTYPGKVNKGKRMAGQLGNRKVTVSGLEIVAVRAEDNVIVIRGSIPGAKGQLVMLKKQEG